MPKFERVELKKYQYFCRADGESIERKLPDHEIKMEFYDDAGAYAFEEWWNEQGAEQMAKWMKTKKDYKDWIE